MKRQRSFRINGDGCTELYTWKIYIMHNIICKYNIVCRIVFIYDFIFYNLIMEYQQTLNHTLSRRKLHLKLRLYIYRRVNYISIKLFKNKTSRWHETIFKIIGTLEMILSHQFSLTGTTFEFTGENKKVFKSRIVAKSWNLGSSQKLMGWTLQNRCLKHPRVKSVITFKPVR